MQKVALVGIIAFMKFLTIFFLLLFFGGCALSKRQVHPGAPKLHLKASSKKIDDNYDEILNIFQKECMLAKVRKLYPKTCKKAKFAKDAKAFFQTNFSLYKIVSKEGLLSGYYEASLFGSRTRHFPFLYPVYAPPKDLLHVELASLYPALRKKRVRGRVERGKVVPYYTRAQQDKIDADVLCYVDDRVKRFFLEIQGSGRIRLDDGSIMYVGYADQNGHPYVSIGKILIQKGYIKKEELSMQRIERFFKEFPKKRDEILPQNPSMVFFSQKADAATGALGIELIPYRSVAVDPSYIPLGSILYYEAKPASKRGIVFAHDTGGAIKGAVRLDLFTGYGQKAEADAGHLRSKLQVWIFLPKEEQSE